MTIDPRTTTFKRHGVYKADPARSRGLQPDHEAVVEGRTLFPGTVKTAITESERVLVSGHNSRKLGGTITKGPWAGMPIFSVTLEERATCPRSCHHWLSCYGNSMHWPTIRRHRPGYLLEAKIIVETVELLKSHGRIAVRLHQLGDFYDIGYLGVWARLIEDFAGLHCFGFTAHPEDSVIGQTIRHLYETSGGRFNIRFSSTETGARRAVTIDRKPEGSKVAEGTVCPAQYGDTPGCGACGFCFDPKFDDRAVVFIQHGMKAPTGKRAPKPVAAPKAPPPAAPAFEMIEIRGEMRRVWLPQEAAP